jgi:hypothetical protein
VSRTEIAARRDTAASDGRIECNGGSWARHPVAMLQIEVPEPVALLLSLAAMGIFLGPLEVDPGGLIEKRPAFVLLNDELTD